MNLFLKIPVSLLVAGAVLYLLEKPMKFGLDNNKDMKSSYIVRADIDAGILLHGDCHPELGLDPQALKPFSNLSFYNLGSINSNFGDNYLFLHHYLKHHKKPKAILMHVFPGSFDSSYYNTFNTFRFVHLLNDKETVSTVKELDPGFAKMSFVPFSKYSYYSNFTFYKTLKGYLDYFNLTHGTFRHPDGHRPPMHKWEGTMGMFKHEKVWFKWSASNEKYLMKIVALAKAENIKLVFFEMPYYFGAKPYFINYEERLERIKAISSNHNIPFYRLHSSPFQSDSTNYSSAYAVTSKGTKQLNELFGQFVRDSLTTVLQ